MSKKRVLFVTQEMEPYTAISEITKIVSKLPQYIQEKGMEIRVLMPRYGNINERRHRLHEVVRLSGMNIIVDDDDFPLIIKVASLPGARMQVYFLDNVLALFVLLACLVCFGISPAYHILATLTVYITNTVKPCN